MGKGSWAGPEDHTRKEGKLAYCSNCLHCTSQALGNWKEVGSKFSFQPLTRDHEAERHFCSVIPAILLLLPCISPHLCTTQTKSSYTAGRAPPQAVRPLPTSAFPSPSGTRNIFLMWISRGLDVTYEREKRGCSPFEEGGGGPWRGP